MCFGSKKESNDDPAPQPRSSTDKKVADTADSKQPRASYNPPKSKPDVAPTMAGPSQPPSNAPPSYETSNPQHDWQVAVPDTSLFPPPPDVFSKHIFSPGANATEADADAGDAWCAQYPLVAPTVLDDAGKGALQFNNIRLMEPVGFTGKLNWVDTGHWQIETPNDSPDRCLISYPPLYLVTEHDPNRLGRPKTIYYEVKVLSYPPDKYAGIALGFTALPYPSFRLPGWQRGSLAIHGDDGHKYVNDINGGKDFTEPFRGGETYGLGMTLRAHTGGNVLVDIFFTRNGVLTGGWNLHEERDADDPPLDGLEGFHDLCASIGTYDSSCFEVIFEPTKWMYQALD
ncbi:unnamed protein product [Clonostachys byssicola]|uniref:SPRY domain-containing protein n=1 Tax=Clonostachys byssicola TaxID=160290 RepID=A0A9N9Y6M5_9HYPO|nr:unnamed protein product [Clonostachys byssicola]